MILDVRRHSHRDDHSARRSNITVKQKTVWQTIRTTQWGARFYFVGCGVLGLIAMGVALMIYWAYEQSGVSSDVSADVATTLRSIVRYLAFGIFPMLATALLIVPFVFWDYVRTCRRGFQLTDR